MVDLVGTLPPSPSSDGIGGGGVMMTSAADMRDEVTVIWPSCVDEGKKRKRRETERKCGRQKKQGREKREEYV